MKKLFFLLLTFILINVLPAQDVSVGMIVPSSGTQGQEFQISITVNKSDVTGFARLQLDMPQGFTVKAGQTQGATFSFKDNKARFLWMSLPAEKTLNLTCSAIADNSVAGSINIEGSFSYVLNNETQRYNIPGQTINFGGASAVADNPQELEAQRLEKERQEKLAREQEEHDRQMKEMAQKEAQVEAEQLAQQYDLTPSGTEVKENTESPDVKSSSQTLESPEVVTEVPQNNSNPEINNTPEVTPETETGNSNTPYTETPVETPSYTPPVETNEPANNYAGTSSENNNSYTSPSSSKGTVEFKVQIGAFKTSPSQGYFRKLENAISEHKIIKSSDSDGYSRYYIGSFNNFSSVDSFHKRVTQLGYESFIVATKDGNRITIKQAKEISNN